MGEWSEAINSIPIAVNVCITPGCSKKLKEVLTQRQEAMLVLMGTLE